MNIQPLINAIRYKLRYGITVEWYNFWYMALRCHQKITPQVASIDETIRIIVEDQCSVSRFGDGEMLLTNPDKEIGFQKGNVLLAQRLKEVLTTMKKDIWFVSPILSKTFIAITAKHADSGELTSFCMAVGGTACCCPTGYTTIHSSPVPTWTSLPKKTAHGGFTK